MENKKVKVGNVYNKQEALQIYADSTEKYKAALVSTADTKNKITNYFEAI